MRAECTCAAVQLPFAREPLDFSLPPIRRDCNDGAEGDKLYLYLHFKIERPR